jgi:nucleoside triphosphatase
MQEQSEKLPTIKRTIASAIVISSDGKVLMGRKDPNAGGVYADVWHIPGGGKEPGETLEEAMKRELIQEASGIDLEGAEIEKFDNVGKGETTKVIDGKKYWCEMEFNRFRVLLPDDAETLSHYVQAGDDLVELQWFSPEELTSIEQIPGGREFFQEIGLIQKTSS